MATRGVSAPNVPLSSVAGQMLKRWRRGAGLTQSELGNRVGLTHNMICLIENGRRSAGQAHLMLTTLGGTSDDVAVLFNLIYVDRICFLLLRHDEVSIDELRKILSTPLRQHIATRLECAIRGNRIFSVQQKLCAAETLMRIHDGVRREESQIAVHQRNQSLFYLHATEAPGAQEYIRETLHYEVEPVVRRCSGITLAALGDPVPLRRDYLPKLRSVEAERDENTGYMGWFSGERRVAVSEAYRSSGSWSGQQTAEWLINDWVLGPTREELNVHSLAHLVVTKGAEVAPQRSELTVRFAHRLDRLRTGVDRTNFALREEAETVYRALDRAFTTGS